MFCRDMSIFCLEVLWFTCEYSGFRNERSRNRKCIQVRCDAPGKELVSVNSCGKILYIQMEMAGDGVDKESISYRKAHNTRFQVLRMVYSSVECLGEETR